MRKRTLWILPVVAGVGMVLVAVLLSSSSLGSPGVPAASAASAKCVLKVTKTADVDEVAAGGQITYTITVTNTGTGDCVGDTVDVTDDLTSTDLTCVSASVTDKDSLTFHTSDINNSCDDNDVEWAATGGTLSSDDSIELELVVKTDKGLKAGDTVSNEVCANADDSAGDPAAEACKTRTTDIVKVTPTPTPKATNTPIPVIVPTSTPFVPPPPPPTAAAAGCGSATPAPAPTAAARRGWRLAWAWAAPVCW